MARNTSTFGQLVNGAPLVGTDILALQRIDGLNYRITADEIATFVGGLQSLNGDATPAQVIAVGAGLGLVDAGATHTISIDSSVVTLTGVQILTNKTLTSPILTTPTIASFVNATHDHTNAAGGGTLLSTAALSDTANIAYLNTPNSYNAGNRQNFLGLLAGTAGINVGAIAGNPTTQIDGDIWYNSSSNTMFGRVNGANVDLGGTGEINTISSVGGGTSDLVAIPSKVGVGLQTKTLSTTAPITLSDLSNIISIGSDFTISSTDILTNKSYDLGGTGNVLTGSVAEFNTALQSDTFAFISDNLSVFAATTSLQLLGVISDETGSGALVFGTSPTIVTPTIASFVNATHDHSNAAGGGTLTNTALTAGTFAAITGLGTQAIALAMGTNLITGIKGTQYVQNTITYNATQVFDLDDNEKNQITLTGVLSTLTTSNRAAGKSKQIFIVGDSSDRVLTFNTSWRTNPSDATVTVTANTFGVLSLYCRGTAETDVFAVYVEFS